MRTSFFLSLLILSIVSPLSLLAQQGRWELLGSRRVNYGLDRDEIPVTVREGFFDALQLRVRGGSVQFHKVVVHYGNGQMDEIELRAVIPSGGQSRVIDLPGNNRVITKVVFYYDTQGIRRGKASVNLWGRH